MCFIITFTTYITSLHIILKDDIYKKSISGAFDVCIRAEGCHVSVEGDTTRAARKTFWGTAKL